MLAKGKRKKTGKGSFMPLLLWEAKKGEKKREKNLFLLKKTRKEKGGWPALLKATRKRGGARSPLSGGKGRKAREEDR